MLRSRLQTSTLALGSSCAFLFIGTKTPIPESAPQEGLQQAGQGSLPPFLCALCRLPWATRISRGPPNVPDTIVPRSPPSSHSEAIILAPSRDRHQAFPTPARPQGARRAETGLHMVLQAQYLEPHGNARKQCNLNQNLFPTPGPGFSVCTLLSLLGLAPFCCWRRKKTGVAEKNDL